MNENEKNLQYENPVNNFPYITEICSFSSLTQSDIVKIVGKREEKNIKRMWAIFGKGKKFENWRCLQVGSSKDIVAELREILKAMISKPIRKSQSTTFGDNVYDFYTYMDKASVKYRSMYGMCEEFTIYEVDIEEYLRGVNTNNYNKVNYAEVKFAFETKALFWNPAPKMNKNQEQEIYSQFLSLSSKVCKFF